MEAGGPAAGMPRRPGHGRRVQVRDFGIVLLLVLASACFQVAAPQTGWARLVTILLGAAILFAAVWAGRAERLLARVAAAAAALLAVLGAVYFAVDGTVPVLLGALVNGLLVAFAPVVIAAAIVRNVRETGAVELPTLSGVLAIYLLIGMFYSFLYAAIQAAGDGDFFAQVANPERSDFLYFSYITQSTTGYGDFTPADDLGRMLAVTEALFGQIYLVTIVALIVANLRPRPR
jgi:Ion channel